jgi:DNA polymerase-1
MQHHLFEESDSYPVAVLSKASSFNKKELFDNYVQPLNTLGVQTKEIIAFTLAYDSQTKVSAASVKSYLGKLLPALSSLGVKYLYVQDSTYFKALVGKTKADPHFGYVLPCTIKGHDDMQVVLGLNYQQLIYNPALQSKLNTSLLALSDHIKGSYKAPGTGIIHSAWYPEGPQQVRQALESLLQYPSLTCDIEGFSLAFHEAGIATISFAWDEHNGIAFACDYHCYAEKPDEGFYGYKQVDHDIRKLLKEFFENYKGELVFHSGSYDIKAMIYALWMKDFQDTEGLLKGLDFLTQKVQDTKIIAYLATNTTAGNVLGLKPLAQEFAGNWAMGDIKDIRKIPLKELLQYNLVDALSTRYVYNKYYPVMVEDKQGELYYSLMLPSMKMLIQVELTGMPMSRKKIIEIKDSLLAIQGQNCQLISDSTIIQSLNLILQTEEMNKANAKLKTKQHPLSKFSEYAFNPNSGPQLQKLLYEVMGLPVLDFTDTKKPATGADTIEKLIHHTHVPAYKELLSALIANGKVTKILSTFIPAFEQAISKDDSDTVWLHGSFNLGGTVSGRLSSSEPNLQNIPAGSDYGKLIKEAFCGPKGWLFCGSDFNSLEDYISALTTKDKNKLAVYEQGFDGHCLRAAYYFKEQCTDIDVTDPVSVNSIKVTYPQLRQDSKAPTFLLTYGGTYHGMMSNLGWPKEKAQAIEKGYHDLYKESDDYIQKRLHQASLDGYVEVAFGLRVRTPLLKQIVFGSSNVPYEAAAEGRTAANAMGQSYGLLNNRAAVVFMKEVWASKHRYDILPVALIHDAIYLLIRDDADTMEWANNRLIEAMKWQELPELHHPVVKLGANLDIYWPNWAHPITLPNLATKEQVIQITNKAKEKQNAS